MPDFDNDALTGDDFEASVRQVARQLYRGSEATGSIKLDGRERDEVIDTGTELIIVEATKLRKMHKVEYDLKKSIDLVRALKATHRFSEYNYRIILVTLDDPTADQNEYVRSSKSGCPKEIISFSTLFSRLFDARHYIRVRGDHSFGSVRNPIDDEDLNVPPSSYIPTALSNSSTGEALKASNLAALSRDGGQFVILGDYGSGKSMTLRDIYFRVRDDFIAGRTPRCPIYLNLREHIAQVQPDEALYRHADKIGFPNPQSLIAAWRAGFVTIFLDGFDELTPPQFAVSTNGLRQARRFAVEVVSRFVEQTPKAAAIFIAGRESYFDERMEARAALGYSNRATVFDLAGFTDDDIRKYLNKRGDVIPAWLPTRPLLLGYLANSGLLDSASGVATLNPAAGWDEMLQRVCAREVRQIWGVGFDALGLRLFIEGLATRARHPNALKGLQQSDIRSVFQTVFGRDADEPANLLTGRLPGLGAVAGSAGAREFIDADFADAAAAGDLGRYINLPFEKINSLHNIVAPVGDLARDLVLWNLKGNDSKLNVALEQASKSSAMAVTASDIISMLMDTQKGYDGENISIKDASFDTFVVDPSINLSRITLVSCIISTLEMSRSVDHNESKSYPKFLDCVIDKLEGAISEKDIPAGVFIGKTSVENYAAFTGTNDAIMKSSLPEPVKVLLTVLRKLFMQRGTGRQYSALRRGLPPKSVKYVEEIALLIKANGFAEDVYLDRRTILIPNRTKSAEALSIINGPNTSKNPLLEAARGL